MATFTPPLVSSNMGGAFQPGMAPKLRNFLGHFSQAYNVWIVDGTTAQSYQPSASYNADGTLNQTGLERTTAFFQGGISYTVTAAQATILTNGGYTVT